MSDLEIRISFSGARAEAGRMAADLRDFLTPRLASPSKKLPCSVKVSLARSDPESMNLGDIVLLAAESHLMHAGGIAAGVAAAELIQQTSKWIAGWWVGKSKPTMTVNNTTLDSSLSKEEAVRRLESAAPHVGTQTTQATNDTGANTEKPHPAS